MRSPCQCHRIYLRDVALRCENYKLLCFLKMLLAAGTALERACALIRLPDLLVHGCLWACGLFHGYYLKYAYVYDNLWQHWYALSGGLMVLLLSLAWTLRKRRQQCYSYDHYYIIFYGLLCCLLGSCFMLSSQLAISYYFSFVGMSVVYIVSFSYISLRSGATGARPARIALGNAMHACGLCSGFVIFNEFEPQHCGIVGLGVVLLLLLLVCLNELLQHLGAHQYKQSPDLVFNLLNEEKLIFLPRPAVLAQFVGRSDYRLVTSRQWRVLLLGGTAVLLQRCCCLYSPAYLQLMWSATAAYVSRSQLYAPFALYAGGCGLAALLQLRYTPKLIYLLFAIIEMTLVVALLCIYDEQRPQHCFLFLALIYATMGVLSSHALHWLLECTPLLLTELALTIGYALQLAILEAYKYETLIDEPWPALLGSSVAALALTPPAVLLVQWLLPPSASLVDVRNRLLGIRRLRQSAVQTQSQFWATNQFLAHDKQPQKLQSVEITEARIFQQYPACNVHKY